MSEPKLQNTMPKSGEFWVMKGGKDGCVMSNRFYFAVRNGKKALLQNNVIIQPDFYPKEGLFITGILHAE